MPAFLESVNFSYLWNGAKYEVRTSAGDGLRYVGSARYRISDGQVFFESIPFSQGRIVATSEGTQAEYHLKDHLGSVRVVTDEDAKIKARYDYLPYGEQHIDPEFPTSDDNDFRFTGKEWLGRFTGLALYDSKARLQDIDGRFLSPDPKANSDPGTSPYAYCAGSPIMRIDPDGQRVWIYYQNENGHSSRMEYSTEMQYNGNNKFASSSINYLNNIYSNGGSQVIGALINSNNEFSLTSALSAIQGTMQFVENPHGGGLVKAGVLLANGFEKAQGIEALAHELFHGIQHEEGQGKTSIYNEVGTYAFGAIIAKNWPSNYNPDFLGAPESTAGYGQNNQYGIAYENAFNALTSQYSQTAFINAIKNFKSGALKNASGLYNRYPLHRHQPKVLLNKYYPR